MVARAVTSELVFEAALVALAGLMLHQRRRPARFFSLVVLAFVVTELCRPGLARIETGRSFFGVHQVVATETANGRYRVLFRGSTIHGAEQVREPGGPSNRHLDLLPVATAAGFAEGLAVMANREHRVDNFLVDALVAVLARNASDMGDLSNRSGWVSTKADGIRAWTDDYSDVLSALARKLLGSIG